MMISKVGTYRNPPEDITDYEAIVSHLNAYTRQLGSQAMILTEWTNTSGTPAIAMGSYISHGGVLYVVESEEAVALPVVDGTYYLKVAASGDTLALSWVSDISGYAWNAIYNGLYHADESQVLPYMLIKTGTSLEKWRITNLMQGGGFSIVRYDGVLKCESLAVTGAINASHINTGQGDFKIGQNLRVTDNVEFGVILSHGRVYDEGSSYTQEIINAQAGDVVVYASDALNTVSNTEGSNLPYTKMKEILVNITGTVTVRFTQSHSVNSYTDTHARIYKNGIAVGTEWQGSSSDIVRSQNFNVIKGDLIQIYGKVTAHASTSEGTVKVSNFRISTLRGFSG